jgi:hypothetical protein
MRKINLLTFHTGIAEHRFDSNNTKKIIELLSNKYIINHIECNNSFMYYNINIYHGSFIIFEHDDTKEFYIYDFGDSPDITNQLIYNDKCIKASVGQYNPKYWDKIVTDSSIRKKIVPSTYPETNWMFGDLNYENIKNFREENYKSLKTELLWRGSTYENHPNIKYRNVRNILNILEEKHSNEIIINKFPIEFNSYINEAVQHRIVFGLGGGGGVNCGDICFRDIEMFGIGVPVLRPTYQIEFYNKLIPDYHYISIDIDIDENYKYISNEKNAKIIYDKYKHVIDNRDFLNFISLNAKQWYSNNCSINSSVIILKNLGIDHEI